MKRAVFHIGPHKTGSTFIQHMMRDNADLFPRSIRPFAKEEGLFQVLHRTTLNMRHESDFAASSELLREASAELARKQTTKTILYSNEDLLGPVPTKAGIVGLYPFIHHVLPAIQQGYADHDVTVDFFFYHREYWDWLHSVHSYKWRNSPREFAPKRFRDRNKLPSDWNSTIDRLRDAVGQDALTIHPYEKDRATQRFGTALFTFAGITEKKLDQFDWIDPVNVSRPETVDPKTW